MIFEVLSPYLQRLRGARLTHISCLFSAVLYTFKMLTLLLGTFLLLSHVHSLDQSLKCNERIEYIEGNRCCKKCLPGQSMLQRCKGSSDTKCKACNTGYYNDEYNIEYMECKPCKLCTTQHIVEKNCTQTHDTVCGCKHGFRCSDIKTCETCLAVQMPPNSEHIPKSDNMWILASLCFACVCVCVLLTCFLLISRDGWPCKRIMSASAGLCSSQKSDSGSSACTEEEEVPMPVQEVCEKSEKLEEV